MTDVISLFLAAALSISAQVEPPAKPREENAPHAPASTQAATGVLAAPATGLDTGAAADALGLPALSERTQRFLTLAAHNWFGVAPLIEGLPDVLDPPPGTGRAQNVETPEWIGRPERPERPVRSRGG